MKFYIIFVTTILLLSTSLSKFALSEIMSDKDFLNISKLIDQQNIDKSFKELKKIKNFNLIDSPRAKLLFGKFYIELQKPSKAMNFFNSVLLSSTKYDASAYAGLAKASFMLGNINNSREYIDASLKVNPDSIDSKIILAQILSENNLNDESKDLFISAMNASRNNSYAGRIYAQTLLRFGRIDDAKNILKQTMIKNSTDALSLELLSDIYWLKGNLEKAIILRTEAEELFRKEGNSIKSKQVINWLNFEALPHQKNDLLNDKVVELTDDKVVELTDDKVVELTDDKVVELTDDNEIDTIAKSKENKKLKPGKFLQENSQLQEKKQNIPSRKIFTPKKEPDDIYLRKDRDFFSGSGVIINNGKWILTNKHVVEGLTYIVVRNGLGEIRNIDINQIKFSINEDLALLKLNDPYPREYSLSMNDFQNGDTGSTVFVLGYPIASILGSFHPTITEGIISNPLGFGEEFGEFQITAKVNPGNSGGPIFNKFGEIVGIATGKIDSQKILNQEGFIPEDINFGVKPERIVSFLNSSFKKPEKRLEYNAEEIYKYMRSGVVFIVGQR